MDDGWQPRTSVDSVATYDGSFDVRIWWPERGSGPGIVLVPEIFGVGPYVEKVASDLARLGYVVGAPDLFWRLLPHWRADHTEEGVRASIELSGGFDFDQGLADCALTLDQLRALPEVTGGVGAIGFCLGGSLSFRLAASLGLDAALSFYGSAVPGDVELLDLIGAQLLLVFGGNDPYIPRDQVEKVEQAAQGRSNVEVYVAEEAGHAFHNSEAPMFHHPDAAARAWAKAVGFLAEHLPV